MLSTPLDRAIKEIKGMEAARQERPMRSFSYGTITVRQWRDGSYSIEGADRVPSDDMVGFSKMLHPFVDAGPAHAVAEKATEPEPIQEHEEGPCPNCGGAKQLAKGDFRKCSGCDAVWKVPSVAPASFEESDRIGG